MKCSYCGRDDLFAVSRTRTITEYRVIDTKAIDGTVGLAPYKNNWLKETDTLTKELKLRCQSCQNDIDKLHGVGEIKIDKTKGVTFITDFWEKYDKED